MRIKKHQSGNEFITAGGVWIRNFTKECISSVQLSQMFDRSDVPLVLKNQELNKSYPKISNEKILLKKLVIVSDGYEFDKRHLLISRLPKEVGVLAVNRAALRWKLLSPTLPIEQRKPINGFVVNNPYKECMSYMPSKENKYYPACLASTRTNYEFLKKYLGDVYIYCPTPEERFGFDTNEKYYIDDYRNPICAAIGLAHHFGVQKLMLLCCDDSFKDEREFSVELANGLHTYPHHLKSDEIIDGNLYWLTHQEDRPVKVGNYSSGAEYKNAKDIHTDDEAVSFFDEEAYGKEKLL